MVQKHKNLVIALGLPGLIILILSCGNESPNKPQDFVVSFQDSALEAAVREAIGIPSAPIYYSDLQELTSLSASGRGIVNLSGLSNCSRLRSLDLSNNNIEDLAALRYLPRLTDLRLGGNRISNLEPLSRLKNLLNLELNRNQINDVSHLSGLIKLEKLNLAANQITEIDALWSLYYLQEFFATSNQIVDISALAAMPLISLIDIRHNLSRTWSRWWKMMAWVAAIYCNWRVIRSLKIQLRFIFRN